MKKLAITLVLALATVTGLAGVSAASHGSVVLAEPCCKTH